MTQIGKPMDDLVKRLRKAGFPNQSAVEMCKEGADEIERLTEIQARIRGSYNDLQAHHEKHCLPSCGMAYGVLLDPAELSPKDPARCPTCGLPLDNEFGCEVCAVGSVSAPDSEGG